MSSKKQKKYKSIDLEPIVIGVTRNTKKRVWLETKVTVKYNDGSTTIDTFDTKKEADTFAQDIMRKYPL
jgi:hypothetical protein